jgi:hypothetical protein
MFIESLNNVDILPLSESLVRAWGEYETIKPTLFKFVPLIFRTYDFSEWTHGSVFQGNPKYPKRLNRDFWNFRDHLNGNG